MSTQKIITDTVEDIMYDLQKYLPQLNSNGLLHVKDKIEDHITDLVNKVKENQ